MKFNNCDSSNQSFKKIQTDGQKLALKLNKLPISKDFKRNKLLRKMLERVGKEVKVYSPFRVDLGKNITIGDYSLINQNCTFLDTGEIVIGKRVLIGPDTKIYTAIHDLNNIKRYKRIDDGYEIQTSVKRVIIDDDVWIGGGCVILPGVHIHSCAIVGAGSVVTKDVQSGEIVAGNPAKLIKKLGGK